MNKKYNKINGASTYMSSKIVFDLNNNATNGFFYLYQK